MRAINSCLSLNDLEVDWKDVDIKSTYRLGPIKTGVSRPRSIKGIFSSVHVKSEIFKNIEKLSKLDAWEGVRLSDAISRKEQNKQRDLRCIFAAAKSRGLNVKLRRSTIDIDDVKYTHKDIDALPHNFSMENVKLVKVSDGYAFQSHFAFLSNMYPCYITDVNIVYKSAEHYYSADMARHHSRQDLIKDILKSTDVYEAKRIVRNIKKDETLDDSKLKIMRKIIMLKFDQNDSLRDRLLGLVGHLYEATKSDLDFACGMTLSQVKDICQENITGKNMLGIILCEYKNTGEQIEEEILRLL